MKLFENILCVADTSTDVQSTIARAVSLAENNQADLTIVDVVPHVTAGGGGRTAAEIQAALTERRSSALASLVAPYHESRRIATQVLTGRTFLAVIQAVLRDRYDLVIKPSENPPFLARLFGSDDMHLLRKCPSPVWLTKPGEKSKYARILAAVDFDLDHPAETVVHALNRQILGLAASLALSDFAELHAIHVWDAPAESALRAWSSDPQEAGRRYVDGEFARHELALRRLRESLREHIGNEAYEHLAPQFHLRRGTPSIVIPEAATELSADLVVMGTVARTGIAGLFIGNTAEAILEQLQCAVLAVKPAGFVSPIAPPAE